MEDAELMRRKMQKLTYKEMLDQQLAAKQLLKMHGNMTEVEKRMNKDDLIAWKNFDNNQYSLIPGVSATKKTLDRSQYGYELRAPEASQAALKSPLKDADKFNHYHERMK